MKKKSSEKISLSPFMKNIVSDKQPETFIYSAGDYSMSVIINPNLSLSDRYQLIIELADMVVSSDNTNEETGEFESADYNPFLFDTVYAYELIKNFTNIDTDTDIINLWEFSRNTSIISDIENAVGGDIEVIKARANELIAFKAQCLANKDYSDLCKAVTKLVTSAETSVNSILKSVTAFAEKYSESAEVGDILNMVKNLKGKEGLITDAIIDRIGTKTDGK